MPWMSRLLSQLRFCGPITNAHEPAKRPTKVDKTKTGRRKLDSKLYSKKNSHCSPVCPHCSTSFAQLPPPCLSKSSTPAPLLQYKTLFADRPVKGP
ncbi:hypothetical protein NPIL_611261 [Nephila pilipes]|uniref:Uncharacterized protein n=1 Tax=Nephila pilipes TaxID=299642 RepID=A0A8X6Q707_NEPPI|nr:hypothetical protein NPIL_611261 [Nephila pilipes]